MSEAITRVEDVKVGDSVTVERDGVLLTGFVDAYTHIFKTVEGKLVPAPATLRASIFDEGTEKWLGYVVIQDSDGVRLPDGERFVSSHTVPDRKGMTYL